MSHICNHYLSILNTSHMISIPYDILHIFNTNYVFRYCTLNTFYKQMFYALKMLTVIELSKKWTP
jgi:hypothetical protein